MFLFLLTVLTQCWAEDPGYEGLSWFVHITDIHISHLEAPDRTQQLQEFVQSTLKVLKPDLVLCGGDLTDAKRAGHLSADQNKEEWETYHRVVTNRWNAGNLPWLDIRGNHDNLNVLSRDSDNNMFANYSVQGPNGRLHSYVVPWESRKQKINFVAIDATWEVGMTFPFNFNGYLDAEERNLLDGIRSNLNKTDSVTIMFGHYPSSVVYQSDYLRDFISSGLVYMSGHLHDLAFFKMNNMYSFHGDKQGLELELVDWKINRAFRLFSIDHGIFSFKDVRFGLWPVVLPTFPKDSQFWMPNRESMDKLKNADVIRVLAFSDVDIVSVRVSVDGHQEREATSVTGGPLYTVPWSLQTFTSGLHTLHVVATDARNRSTSHTHTFTFNPEEAQSINNWLPNLVMCSSWATIFHIMFIVTLLGNLVVLGTLRYLYIRATVNRNVISRFTLDICCSLVRKLLLVCSYDRLFYPLLVFVLYMAVGPWVVGGILEGHMGAIFAWGAIVEGKMTHSQTTFVWYFIHFTMLHPLIVLVIGHLADWRCGYVTASHTNTTRIQHSFHALLLLCFVCGSIFFSITFWQSFGVLGFFLGPLKTWSYLFYGGMLWVAATLPEEACTKFVRIMKEKHWEKKTDGDPESTVALDSEQ